MLLQIIWRMYLNILDETDYWWFQNSFSKLLRTMQANMLFSSETFKKDI